ncbi:MAG: nucleotidyl transferase AbiEii/AbiGii toxin family protein [Prolixibacteraceae bacterium]|jgi:predicted nucleotidyltransferase component of viral defense system|nr:nucleotidyl transferase AbiEii/AbiGii toxin family protein [Prolixibacteraceae bacterium]
MIDPKYRRQVDLLLQTIPYVAKEQIFVLKGGTAINLFIRDMPRLSVDIDLTYLPLNNREQALENISDGLTRIREELLNSIPGLSVTGTTREGHDAKINCQLPGAQIKIEVNTTTRGNIYPSKLMRIKNSVEESFGRFAAMNVVSLGELFGGKICAALDRQHPRDLFDVRLLLDNEGITNEIKTGFLMALISHMRPIHEVIKPLFIDQRQAFETQFAGMTSIPFTYTDYEDTRHQLVEELNSKLDENDRFFLISLKKGIPEWERFEIKNAKDFPAVQWKLKNIEFLKNNNATKFNEMVFQLEKVFGL